MSDRTKRLLCVIFGGWFGLHKYIEGKTGMGILYTFTFGLFGFGWIIDIFREIVVPTSVSRKLGSRMPLNAVDSINHGHLMHITNTPINLAAGEYCCFVDNAYTFIDKTITAGYTGKSGGASVYLGYGLRVYQGSGARKAIRQNERTNYPGTLYLTNKRVIFSAAKRSFDVPMNKITTIGEATDGIILQVGNQTYPIVFETHSVFAKAYNLVRFPVNENVRNYTTGTLNPMKESNPDRARLAQQINEVSDQMGTLHIPMINKILGCQAKLVKSDVTTTKGINDFIYQTDRPITAELLKVVDSSFNANLEDTYVFTLINDNAFRMTMITKQNN
jgi:hypothetical protein